MPIRDAFSRLGISHRDLDAMAYHQGRNKTPLHMMYSPIRRIDRLFSWLGIRDPYRSSAPTTADSVSFAGGLTVTAKGILQAFQWSEASYGKKAAAYQWARRAARPETEWKDPIPRKPSRQ